MQDTFTPAVLPPEARAEKAFFFAFRGDQLLVEFRDRRAYVPRLMIFEELGLPAVQEHYLGVSEKRGHCFAVELPEDVKAPPGTAFHGLRQLYEILEEDLLWIGGRAVQIVNWCHNHQFCGRCGGSTQPHPTERARICPRCDLMFFPRLSPAVIVLIQKGDQFLLARNHRFPPGLYSIIAGFVEPGETLEEAVVREVREEVGIAVKNIRYFGSQSWPFPNSLMLGFPAEYAGGEIRLEDEELADAGWYTRDPDKLPNLPDGLSISRQLINWFLERDEYP